MIKIFMFIIIISVVVFSQDGIFRKWKTIDDETGKPKSIVEIYEKNGKIFGKIVDLFREPNEDQDPICTKCEDFRKNQKIRGMVIITNLQKNGDVYEGGEILDPKKGKIYKCKIWLENGVLKVRGYWGFIYRTQTWYPVN
ncbi:MAG TPA: DUF2147 domain-containing protein [Ignavibacteriales bacterium]|jgi:uncharacterized protein (DUF2147 family)|nr:DUF2147 domain-containing protein [Ignavibacteriales bacterium]